MLSPCVFYRYLTDVRQILCRSDLFPLAYLVASVASIVSFTHVTMLVMFVICIRITMLSLADPKGSCFPTTICGCCLPGLTVKLATDLTITKLG